MTSHLPISTLATQRYRPVFAALREAGVDVEQTLSALGFTTSREVDPLALLPRERVNAMFQQLILAAPQAELGLLAALHFELPDVGTVGYLLRHSEHPLAALERLSRYTRLIPNTAACEVYREDGSVFVVVGLSGARTSEPFGLDYCAGMVVRIVGELSGGRVHPLEASLCRPRPRRLEPYRQLFGKGVGFDADRTFLRYDESALLVPAARSDPQLVIILEQHAQAVLARLPGASAFSEELRVVLERLLARGEACARGAADELGLSERTLRRKLAASGCTYRDLLDEIRREHALAMLGEGRLSITDIAQRVGFGDATAFTRSFRRWTGRSPSVITATRRRT